MYSMRQPLGVVAGITPFNFPAMIPMWKFVPGDRLRQRLHPEALRARSVRAAAARRADDRGRPARRRSSTSSTATRRRSTPSSTHPDIAAVGFVGSTPIADYVYATRLRQRQARPVLRRRQEPHDHHARCRPRPGADALIGAGYGSAGERCMAISVAVPVGEETADALIEQADPRGREA